GNVDTFSGGGGLVSTLADYFRFVEMIRLGGALEGHRLLSPRTVAFMRRNHLAGDIASMGPSSFAEMPMDGVGFGLGGFVVLDPGRMRAPGSVGDYSWGGMASTIFWTDPIEQLSVIFFTQLIPSSTYANRPELKALVHAALVD
ncbi:MAG: serine hydrolase, partial [Rhizobiales bacterium]|nr:serine hydrolase [Hyphomicrobiales bacterium]